MKTLFITSNRFDYNQDLAYSGLLELLGPSKVRTYPFTMRFHSPRVQEYPKNLFLNSHGRLRPLIQSLSITPENAEMVIVAACKPDAFAAYLQILQRIPESTPTIFIDGGDREEIGDDLIRLKAQHLWDAVTQKRPFDIIFKREYFKNRNYAPNVFPLPFSYNRVAFNFIPSHEKKYDVTFWAVESHPIRTAALHLLKGRFDCDQNGTGRDKKMKNYAFKGRRYHEELSKSRIVLSLRGGGWDTLRYWEVPALGPLLVSTELDIVIPNDFINGESIVRCKNDLSDLIDILTYYLNHPDKAAAIAQNARKHLMQFHTNTQRAESMLNTIKKIVL